LAIEAAGFGSVFEFEVGVFVALAGCAVAVFLELGCCFDAEGESGTKAVLFCVFGLEGVTSFDCVLSGVGIDCGIFCVTVLGGAVSWVFRDGFSPTFGVAATSAEVLCLESSREEGWDCGFSC